MRHIEEARALSERLGGMDKEVKDFFFNLSPDRLSDVLDRYGRKFGEDKRAYAEETFPLWKSGQRKMSGLVAGRLFDLLPPIMPMDLKLRIVEGLFERAGKARTDHVLVPMNADPKEIVQFVDEKCFGYLSDVGIDKSVKRQFDWLSGEDAEVAEQLFKHVTQVNFKMKKAASAAMIGQLDQDRTDHGDTIREVVSTISLRQHDVHIKRTPLANEMRTVDPITFRHSDQKQSSTSATSSQKGSDLSWLWWIGGLALLVWFLNAS